MPDLHSNLEVREEVLPVADGGLSRTFDIDEPASASPEAVTRDSVIAMFGGVVSQGFKFLTLIYVARRLSAADFGMVVFAMAINAFIFVVSNFGLPVYGAREVSKRAYISSQLLQSVVTSRVLLPLLGTAGAVVYAPQWDFERGLVDTVHWYQRNTACLDEVRSGECRQYFDRHYNKREQALAIGT